MAGDSTVRKYESAKARDGVADAFDTQLDKLVATTSPDQARAALALSDLELFTDSGSRTTS